ncbi:MAG: hypothetical protein M0019_11140, partial [Actinomycetota bacterium]|nr:hypothetical protein [Actinomycetota bacterium]
MYDWKKIFTVIWVLVIGTMGSAGSVAIFESGAAGATALAPTTSGAVVGGTLFAGNSASGTVTGYSSITSPYGTTAPTLLTQGQNLLDNSQKLIKPTGVTADANGNIWVADSGSNEIFEFTKAELRDNADPAVVISSTTTTNTIDNPIGLAFDSSGNLWIVNEGSGSGASIVEFSSSDLAQSGAPTPTLDLPLTSGLQPSGMTIHSFSPSVTASSSPYLWVTGSNPSSGQGFIYGFDVKSLSSSNTTPSPSVVIDTGSYAPSGLAFDESGNLWAPEYSYTTYVNLLVAYSNSQLQGAVGGVTNKGATQSPVVVDKTTLSPFTNAYGYNTCYSLDEPTSITFDSSGNLYVANSYCNTYGIADVAMFSAADLAGALQDAVNGHSNVSLTMTGQFVTSQLTSVAAVAFLPGSNQGQLLIVGRPGFGGYVGGLNLPLSGSHTLGAPSTLATDSSGDIWVANDASSTIDEYTPAEIISGGGPNIEIQAQKLNNDLSGSAYYSIDGPAGMAFDAQGNLWVSNSCYSAYIQKGCDNSIVEYSKSELSMTNFVGALPPVAIYVTDVHKPSSATTNAPLDNPTSISIHAVGNSTYLWIENASSTPSISAIPLGSLDKTGLQQIPTPALTIVGSATGLDHPTGLSFDAQGNLWISNDDSTGNSQNFVNKSSLIEFSSSQLTSDIGSVKSAQTMVDQSPNLEIVPTSINGNQSLDYPVQIAFDTQGNLFIDNLYLNGIYDKFGKNGSLVEYGASELETASANAAKDPGNYQSQPLTPLAMNYGPGSGLWDPAGLVFVPNQAAIVPPTNVPPTNLPPSTVPPTVVSPSTVPPLGTSLPSSLGTPNGQGYILVGKDGGIFSFGGSSYKGSIPQLIGSHVINSLNQPIVGAIATPDGKGYWLVASDGGVFSFGGSSYKGSIPQLIGSHVINSLNQPIVGAIATPDGKGYWLVASDGGVFSFGDAAFYGSEGGKTLNQPIVGAIATPDGKGYWLVASDGGVFSFGDAAFYGSEGGKTLNQPIVGAIATPDGKGYW